MAMPALAPPERLLLLLVCTGAGGGVALVSAFAPVGLTEASVEADMLDASVLDSLLTEVMVLPAEDATPDTCDWMLLGRAEVGILLDGATTWDEVAEEAARGAGLFC